MSTAANFAYPGAYSGFIPSFEASGMLIDYTRDPKTFKIAEYAQYIPSKKPVGIYGVLDADAPARLVTDDDFAWPDGAEIPAGNDNLQPFVFLDYRCVRKAYTFTLGDETIDNSDWKVLAAHAGLASQECMTGRTWQTYLLLNGQVQNGQPASGAAPNPAAVWGTSYGTPAALGVNVAGFYSASDDENSPNFLAIKKTLLAIAKRINLLTNGKVQRKDLRLVMGPDDAQAISNTAEIQNFLKNNQYALAQVKGNEPGQNELWGLPDYYAGFQLVVEDAVRVAARPNVAAAQTTTGMSLAPIGTTGREYIWQPGTMAVLSRKGALEGTYGMPSYSTLQVYFYREMEVGTYDDRRNERTEGRVVESRAIVVAAPAAGFWLTGINH